ncbi:hypothetical protein SDC9_186913 [bioreactor metagenome]|uniref:Uncharacterized protein n=1 Tax=bioreactor metagenome TaxID=1076179 RepID=A0A645HK45_9ZZZZ
MARLREASKSRPTLVPQHQSTLAQLGAELGVEVSHLLSGVGRRGMAGVGLRRDGLRRLDFLDSGRRQRASGSGRRRIGNLDRLQHCNLLLQILNFAPHRGQVKRLGRVRQRPGLLVEDLLEEGVEVENDPLSHDRILAFRDENDLVRAELAHVVRGHQGAFFVAPADRPFQEPLAIV